MPEIKTNRNSKFWLLKCKYTNTTSTIFFVHIYYCAHVGTKLGLLCYTYEFV